MTSRTSKLLPFLGISIFLGVVYLVATGVDIPPQMWTVIQLLVPLISGGGLINKALEAIKRDGTISLEDVRAIVNDAIATLKKG